MAARVLAYSDLAVHVGQELGVSGWIRVTQDEVDAYADATNDHQWFCEDPERAARESPFGGTVAPGYFLLALVPGLLKELWYVDGARMAINYGIDRLRFPAPLRVGRRVRLRAVLAAVVDRDRGRDVTLELALEGDDGSAPVCAARVVYRFLAPGTGS